jgi:BirA family biotin operon repressor/biotin-[acetyl-CoA-carboxylase] ligase
VSTVTPRPPLDISLISEKISRYWRVSVVEVTGSTQDDLLASVARNDARNGDVIVTEFQSAGRGRLDRKFDAPHSSALMFSLYLEPTRDKSDWSFLPLLSGLIASLALAEIDPRIEVSLKWPNDLLITEKKVGGIIAHATEHGIVIGIGINVAMTESELPVTHATSLALSQVRELDRNLILANFLTQYEEIFLRWEAGEDLRHLYRDRSATIGKDVRVDTPQGAHINGLAIDIAPNGELILKDGNRVTVGDVVHLR